VSTKLPEIVAQLLEQVYQAASRIERASTKSLAYDQIAQVYLQSGQKSPALDLLIQALKTAESLKYPQEKAIHMAGIARLFAKAGDIQKARELYQTSILWARASMMPEKVRAMSDIAREYVDAGLETEAVQLSSELRDLLAETDKAEDISGELVNIAEILNDASRNEIAENWLDDAAKMANEIKDNWFRAERLTEAASGYAMIGNNQKALEVIGRVMPAANNIDYRECQPFFLLKIADVYIIAGQKLKAREILTGMTDIVNRDESAYSRSGDLMDIAERYSRLGDQSTCLELLARSRAVITEIDKTEDKIERLVQLAEALKSAGQTEQALEIAGQAVDLCKTITNKRSTIHLLGDLALLLMDLGERDKSSNIISGIIQTVQESQTKTAGLGVLAAELADRGDFVSTLQLARIIREPEAKVNALIALTSNMIKTSQEPSKEMEELVRNPPGQ
jgi:tetratricopeptide (TPR) repeat protein